YLHQPCARLGSARPEHSGLPRNASTPLNAAASIQRGSRDDPHSGTRERRMRRSTNLCTATMVVAVLTLASTGVSVGSTPTAQRPSVASESLARRTAANAAIARDSVASKSLARRAAANAAAA